MTDLIQRLRNAARHGHADLPDNALFLEAATAIEGRDGEIAAADATLRYCESNWAAADAVTLDKLIAARADVATKDAEIATLREQLAAAIEQGQSTLSVAAFDILKAQRDDWADKYRDLVDEVGRR